MPIARTGNFLTVDDIGFTPSLGIESGNMDACIREVNRLGLKGVFGCPCFGFRETDLDFLPRMPQLIQVWLWEVSIGDVSGIYALEDLQLFNVHNRKQGIDFARLPRLKHAIWYYQSKDVNLGRLQGLDQLDVWHFNPKSRSFRDCSVPPSVQRLEINWANPSTLDGLPALPRCKELQLHYCRNLTSLAGIEGIAPNLERLIVTRSKRCTDIAAIDRLAKLEHVFVNKAFPG